MKKITSVFIIGFLLVVPVFLPGQTAAEMEELLGKDAVSYQQAASFVLKAAEVKAPNDAAGAFSFAAEQKWLPKNAAAGGEARLDGVSLLLMQSFAVKGGLWYSIFKNPHYAYREMVYREIIQGRVDPGMAVSGSELIYLVNRILSIQGDGTKIASKTGGQP